MLAKRVISLYLRQPKSPAASKNESSLLASDQALNTSVKWWLRTSTNLYSARSIQSHFFACHKPKAKHTKFWPQKYINMHLHFLFLTGWPYLCARHCGWWQRGEYRDPLRWFGICSPCWRHKSSKVWLDQGCPGELCWEFLCFAESRSPPRMEALQERLRGRSWLSVAGREQKSCSQLYIVTQNMLKCAIW